jgi:hypothetical protein
MKHGPLVHITFDIDRPTWDILRTHLKHGSRKYVYRVLIEGFAHKLEQDPKGTLRQVVAKQWDLGDYLHPQSE